MNGRPLSLTILLWLGVIISARVLLFCIPFLINKLLNEDMTILSSQDRIVLILAIVSFFCFAAGLWTILRRPGSLKEKERGGLNADKI